MDARFTRFPFTTKSYTVASLWRRWMLANGVAEAAGLGATLALDAVILSTLDLQSNPLRLLLGIVMITVTGALEGVIVGVLQWRVLRTPFPQVTRRSWLTATVAGAMIAWFLGSLPNSLIDFGAQQGGVTMQEPPAWTVYVLAAGMGLALGPVLGIPQWRVLRRHAWGLGCGCLPTVWHGQPACRSSSLRLMLRSRRASHHHSWL